MYYNLLIMYIKNFYFKIWLFIFDSHNTYKSDWDPETKLMYVVRKNYEIICNIEPFIEKI